MEVYIAFEVLHNENVDRISIQTSPGVNSYENLPLNWQCKFFLGYQMDRLRQTGENIWIPCRQYKRIILHDTQTKTRQILSSITVHKVKKYIYCFIQ